MPDREPKYETRYWVDGTRFHFAEERQAKAFALPGQPVVPVRRRVYEPDETLEFILGSRDANSGDMPDAPAPDLDSES